MKKKYSKPELYIENFQLTQSIAKHCGAKDNDYPFGTPGYAEKGTCGWNVDGLVIWVAAATGCNGDLNYSEDVEVMGLCYNNPNGANQIFAS